MAGDSSGGNNTNDAEVPAGDNHNTRVGSDIDPGSSDEVADGVSLVSPPALVSPPPPSMPARDEQIAEALVSPPPQSMPIGGAKRKLSSSPAQAQQGAQTASARDRRSLEDSIEVPRIADESTETNFDFGSLADVDAAIPGHGDITFTHDSEQSAKRLKLDSPCHQEEPRSTTLGTPKPSKQVSPPDDLTDVDSSDGDDTVGGGPNVQEILATLTGWLNDIVINQTFQSIVACPPCLRTFSSPLVRRASGIPSEQKARKHRFMLVNAQMALDQELEVIMPLHLDAH